MASGTRGPSKERKQNSDSKGLGGGRGSRERGLPEYSQAGRWWGRSGTGVVQSGPRVREASGPGTRQQVCPARGSVFSADPLRPVASCASCPAPRPCHELTRPTPPALQEPGACPDSETLCCSFQAAILAAGSVNSSSY